MLQRMVTTNSLGEEELGRQEEGTLELASNARLFGFYSEYIRRPLEDVEQEWHN